MLRVIGVILLIALQGCTSTSYNNFSNQVQMPYAPAIYHNKTIGISFTYNSNWYIPDESTNKALEEEGAKLLFGDKSKTLQRFAEASKDRVGDLFTSYKHPPGVPVESNPSFLLIAEDVKPFPGIRHAGDYLIHFKRTLALSKAENIFSGIEKIKIGENTFHALSVKMKLMGRQIKQAYVAIKHKDIILVSALTYDTEKDRHELNDFVKSIKLYEPEDDRPEKKAKTLI